MHRASLSKRDFLRLSTGTLLACAAGLPASCASAGKDKKIPVGLQLYSVREDCAKDLVKTVTAVARMGYRGVEFAGYHGRDAKTLRRLLDDVGVVCCGTHIGLDTLLGDNLPQTIEFNQTLGNRFLIVPGLDAKHTSSRQAWLNTARLFNEIAEKVKPHGMRVGYHNHTTEFHPLDGELPWDTFFGNTRKDVVMQFDTGNAMHGGGDATVYLKRYPGRAATVHIKPFSKSKPNALLGDDELPWPDIFRLCETIGNTEWYIVEYESDAYPPLISVEKTLEVMRRWGKC
ncbi:MAG TPA: sugar phosphate isomerase/epimerase [Verrucomicrobiota bacterium]|nr:sugar phosphate isomerase/epimerase [Verrucomicrobiota bacterium]HNU49697.1 sugar phosphate isomerase/epimerase [Verrucomicrobiota bacterium]